MAIFYVGGNKPGVGCSTISMAIIDLLVSLRQPVTVIDGDCPMAHLTKAYGKDIPCKTLDLFLRSGWIELMNLTRTEANLVIDVPSRCASGLKFMSEIIVQHQKDIKQPLLVFWVIQRDVASVEMLRDFIDATGLESVVVIKNCYKSSPAAFTAYNESGLSSRVAGEIYFPELDADVCDKIMNGRLSVTNAMKSLDHRDRELLKQWRTKVWEAFAVL